MKRFFILLFALTCLLALSACGIGQGEKYAWSDIRLHEMLPVPHSNRGEIHDNSDESLDIDVFRFSAEEYSDYVDDCKEKGFVVDADSSSDRYEAYNQDGYKLALSYWKSEKQMSISLEAPMEMGELQWPRSDIAKLLPIPKSTMGSIDWEAEHGFVIYVGDSTTADFNEYADACAEKGFTVDYRRGNDYYYAYNADGYDLSLRYEGNNIMFIRIDAPDDSFIPEDTAAPGDDTEGPTDDPENTAAPVDGIRPEFKEAMDSYEAFFDEYVAFMKNFSSNPNSMLSLMGEYTNFLTRYSETMEAMDALGEEEMSAEESAYYLEATARINQKLLSVLS